VTDILDLGRESLPFHSFLWKVASRCNINCSYCYVYNLGDDTWRAQPHFMSPETARRTAQRMREHLDRHGKKNAAIIFHGGEPMMLGPSRISQLVKQVREVFEGSGIEIKIGMQSNLLLFNEAIGECLSREGITLGVSIDGPPHANDIHRIDFKGRGTGRCLEEKLELLLTPRFRHLFSGFLCVVNPATDPVEIVDYLLSFHPHSIDFLLPLFNHDNLPPSYRNGKRGVPYGDWLIRCFDRWIQSGSSTRIRYFNSIIRMLCGSVTSVESIGTLPVDIIVVESNGSIEAVDSLKAAFPGAAQLGFSVHENSFDEVMQHYGVRVRQLGARGLCDTCQRCELVDVCGGGYYPHRYSRENGFNNPTVYCADLMKLITHIKSVVLAEIESSLSRDQGRQQESGTVLVPQP
jgi:uncharacterized protein